MHVFTFAYDIIIMSSFQDEGAPERTVKVGLESISLDSWSRLIQCNMFRELLGSGMTAHIQGNELLREVFKMGPAPLTTVESKASRLERVRNINFAFGNSTCIILV